MPNDRQDTSQPRDKHPTVDKIDRVFMSKQGRGRTAEQGYPTKSACRGCNYVAKSLLYLGQSSSSKAVSDYIQRMGKCKTLIYTCIPYTQNSPYHKHASLSTRITPSSQLIFGKLNKWELYQGGISKSETSLASPLLVNLGCK